MSKGEKLSNVTFLRFGLLWGKNIFLTKICKVWDPTMKFIFSKVRTQRRFSVHTTSFLHHGRCIDIETTLCPYWVMIKDIYIFFKHARPSLSGVELLYRGWFRVDVNMLLCHWLFLNVVYFIFHLIGLIMLKQRNVLLKIGINDWIKSNSNLVIDVFIIFRSNTRPYDPKASINKSPDTPDSRTRLASGGWNIT